MTYRTQRHRKRAKTRSLRYSRETERVALEALTRTEREGLARVAEEAARHGQRAAIRAMKDYAVTRYRQSGKAAQDAARDGRTRKLVGARVSRDKAAQVEIAAMASGRSVYRFVTDALEAELERENMRSTLECRAP